MRATIILFILLLAVATASAADTLSVTRTEVTRQPQPNDIVVFFSGGLAKHVALVVEPSNSIDLVEIESKDNEQSIIKGLLVRSRKADPIMASNGGFKIFRINRSAVSVTEESSGVCDVTPLTVTIDVNESLKGNLRALANASITLKDLNGGTVASGQSDAEGKAVFPLSLDKITAARGGLSVKVTLKGFEDKPDTIPGSMLKGSESLWNMTMTRTADNPAEADPNLPPGFGGMSLSEWEKKFSEIAARVAAAEAKRTEFIKKAGTSQNSTAKVDQAEAKAREQLAELKKLKPAVDRVEQYCKDASKVNQKLEELEKTIREKEKDATKLTDELLKQTDACASREDIAKIREGTTRLRKIIDDLADPVKEARKQNDELKRLQIESLKELAELKKALGFRKGVADQEEVAGNAFRTAMDDYAKLAPLESEINSARFALSGELAKLRSNYPANPIPQAVEDRITELDGRINSLMQGVSTGPPPTGIAAKLLTMAALTTETNTLISQYQAAVCTITTREDLLDKMVGSVTFAGLSLQTIVSSEPQIKRCEAKLDCAGQLIKIGQALDIGDLETSTQIIAEIKNNPCQTSAVEARHESIANRLSFPLASARNLWRDIATHCNYRMAYDAAVVIQQMFPRHPWVVKNFADIERAWRVKQEISALVDKLVIEDKARNYDEGKKIITQIDQIAAPYPCMADENKKLRAEYERGKPDWTDLLRAIEALEPRVLAWNNDIAAAGQAIDLLRTMFEQAPKTKERSAAILREIEAAGVIAHGVNGVSPANNYCTMASSYRSNIRAYKTQADAQEKTLKSTLDNALALSASCSTAKDGESLRTMHRNAIQIAGAIGLLEKKAIKENDDLKKLANEKKDGAKIIEEVEKKVAELSRQAANAEFVAANAGTTFARADNLHKSLIGRHAALTGEINGLPALLGLDSSVEGLPPDLARRVAVMRGLLAKQTNNTGGPDISWPTAVKDAATKVEADKVSAEALLARYKSVTGASCDDAAMDDIVQEIGAATAGASIELGAAGDLEGKASECTKRGACAPVVSEVRALLQQGSVQPAEAKMSEARAQGCDVSGLDQELDYYKTLNEAVALLKTGLSSCRFQESLDFAQRFPVGVLEKGPIRQAIADLRAGLEAQMATRALLEQARQAKIAQNISEQDRYLADAKSRASNYPCLINEVNNFNRGQVKGTGVLGSPVDKPKLEEIPDDVIEAGDIIANINKKPKIEEIPDDDDTTGHRPPDKPVIEEIPDDVIPQKQSEDITVGDNKNGPVKTTKEPKPKKPGGGFWENLGKAAGVVINEINKNKPPISGGDGGNQPPPRDTGTASGGTGAGIPNLAGRWKNSSGTEFVFAQSGSTFNWRVAKFGGYGDPTEWGTGEIIDRINLKATVNTKDGTFPLTGDFAFYQNGIVGRISFNRWHWLSRID